MAEHHVAVIDDFKQRSRQTMAANMPQSWLADMPYLLPNANGLRSGLACGVFRRLIATRLTARGLKIGSARSVGNFEYAVRRAVENVHRFDRDGPLPEADRVKPPQSSSPD